MWSCVLSRFIRREEWRRVMFMTTLADIGKCHRHERERERERAMSEVDVSFHAVEADEDHSTSQWEPIKAAE